MPVSGSLLASSTEAERLFATLEFSVSVSERMVQTKSSVDISETVKKKQNKQVDMEPEQGTETKKQKIT